MNFFFFLYLFPFLLGLWQTQASQEDNYLYATQDPRPNLIVPVGQIRCLLSRLVVLLHPCGFCSTIADKKLTAHKENLC